MRRKLKFKKLHLEKFLTSEVFLMVILISLGVVVFVLQYKQHRNVQTSRQLQIQALSDQLDELKIANNDLLMENERVVEAYQTISTESAVLENEKWKSAVDLYKDLSDKYGDYSKKGLDLSKYDDDMNTLVDELVVGDYEKLDAKVTELDAEFEKLMKAKIEEDKKKAEAAAKKTVISAPVSNSPGSGYSRITVNTERGNFVTSIILVDMGQVQAVTATGQDGNCDNGCVTKPLASYVSENSGFAGINGTYFCPPDYASCSGKVNSYDFPVYSSQHHKWINEDKLFWNSRGMMAWSGSSNWFCADAKSCNPGVTAGIVNYPSLINNGNIVVEVNSLPNSLKNVRGYRGAVGTNGNWLYLMAVRGATVPDVAYVMKALGIKNGLNLDGGGSMAMYYNGRYVLGPGRNLPNALVLKYR